MEPIIDASHVYIRYLLGDFRDIGLKEWTIQKVKRERRVESRWSVEDVSFTLEKGDFLGIIGANGVEKRLAIDLPEDELKALHFSAESIKTVLRANKLID